MNKMITIYELLGLVKDGKAPKIIKFDGIEWKYTGHQYERLDKENLGNIWNGYNFNILNDTVEILEEENKIEKLGDFDLTKYSRNDEDLGLTLNYTGVSNTFNDVHLKINELIDEINKLKEEK